MISVQYQPNYVKFEQHFQSVFDTCHPNVMIDSVHALFVVCATEGSCDFIFGFFLIFNFEAH